ncbi:SRPBCC family protein [Ferrimicrobium acidiphilum]|uniref:Carbon monoxide dehydrogenase subunit G (CoxG) n=1 Tax=Ferrimicrobium acidiphilum DSM 19497 TaxID=1121877 RepID=A0A0D8FX17_9ACTN|nr:SRPBCC family protein [Ferrimicrobium acidiphilum]KJE77524.1 carbon monoxide dehydrogenase subunit G (CoxG) [Ferrimicrobium acidiphilum DSM 19497]
MEIVNEFTVPVGVDQAWEILTDLERIAPCLPGASLSSVEGDEHKGSVKIKVGPITANYAGVARFESKDVDKRIAVLRAEGRETKGQGNASAVVTARLIPDGDSTRVTVDVDLTIAGRVAQFGRGVLGEVSEKLMGEFATRLAELIGQSGSSEPAESETSEPSAAAEATESRAEEPAELNAMRVLAKPIAKRLAPVAAVLIVVAVLVRRRGRRSA